MRFLAPPFSARGRRGRQGRFSVFFHPEGAQRKKSTLHRFFLKKDAFASFAKAPLTPRRAC